MKEDTTTESIEIGNANFICSRPHSLGLVIHGPEKDGPEDYLHALLLTQNREAFFSRIEQEGLVVCKAVVTSDPRYRNVRGKSSHGKLSQAEYYHHDGCSSPSKPRFVEIRCPYQKIGRSIATAVARLPDVMRAMLKALPEHLLEDAEFVEYSEMFSGEETSFPDVKKWDQIQGRVTRLVRRKLDAETCRAYFRKVDGLARAYVLPWEMGESRMILNSTADLRQTMQHRRSYQVPRAEVGQNGSLVKRWTAEET